MTLLARLRSANREKSGVFVLLGCDLAAFLLGTVLYFTARSRTVAWPRPFHFPTGVMTFAMIMFAVAASFVMHVAVRSAKQGDAALSQRMIALAIVAWLTFLFLLAMEWGRLYLIEHVSLNANPWHVPAFGVCYYGLSGYQAVHVLIGSAWMAAASLHPLQWRLRTLTWFVDLTNLLFILLAFLLIFPSTDLNGF